MGAGSIRSPLPSMSFPGDRRQGSAKPRSCSREINRKPLALQRGVPYRQAPAPQSTAVFTVPPSWFVRYALVASTTTILGASCWLASARGVLVQLDVDGGGASGALGRGGGACGSVPGCPPHATTIRNTTGRAAWHQRYDAELRCPTCARADDDARAARRTVGQILPNNRSVGTRAESRSHASRRRPCGTVTP
jgi:hypothetical protein